MQPHEIWIEPRRHMHQYFFVRQVVHGASYPQTRFSYYTPAVRLASPAKTNVIPGRPEGPGPESITPAQRSMDSGLAASRRPGMTNNNPAISEMAEGGALENKRLAAGPDKPGALARLDQGGRGRPVYRGRRPDAYFQARLLQPFLKSPDCYSSFRGAAKRRARNPYSAALGLWIPGPALRVVPE